MIEIKIPTISANEDTVIVSKIMIKNNSFYKKGKVICILETSKTSLDLELEEDGFVYFLSKENHEIKTGSVIALLSKEKIKNQETEKYMKTENGNPEGLNITKKAQILINSNKLNYKDIKSKGIIKELDVINLLKKFEKENLILNNDKKNEDYVSLKKIMSDDNKISFDEKNILNLKKTLQTAQDVYRKKWNRTVPSIEALFDRWSNAKNYSSDDKTNISHLSYIIGDVKLGKNVYVGPFTFLDGGGGLKIEDYTSIAAGVQIYSHDNISRALSGHKGSSAYSKTEIGKCCFIGPNAVITRGVKIGDHCFIGANSVVTFDVPSNTAVSGNPGTKIGVIKIETNGEIKIIKERSY